MERARRFIAAVAFACLPLTDAEAYDTESHRVLGEIAADGSIALQRVILEDLARPSGRNEVLRDGTRSFKVREWMGEGAREEDYPPQRAFNHFHNPFRPWSKAGLTLVSGKSSVLWTQDPNQDANGVDGGQWSWSTAREAYLAALTGPTLLEREASLARALRALGHVTHLIQDVSLPAHARNDPHLSIQVMSIRIPIDPDPYEDWVETFRQKDARRFEQLSNSLSIRPSLTLFRPTGDERAPVPIAGLIDTQDLRRVGIVRGVFDPPDVGLAEFVNPNYLSGDTIFKNFALPRPSQLGTPFFELDEGKFRRYWPKVAGAAVEVAHFVAEGALYQSLFDAMPEPPGVAWVLDDRVAEDYATDLLPRAVGYSAALIDYFFRGRLDVDVLDNAEAGEPSQLRLVGKNASEEPLVSGGLFLYADDVSGRRKRLEPVSGSIDEALIRNIGPGSDLVSTWFTATDEAERFVAVYQGALGDEPETPYPGAVIGKVIGGVRVEHVFADGESWKIRTPAGVFTLPLTTADFSEVRWGSAADVLVARTWFGEGQPNRFASFAVQRRPGSIDFVTEADSGLLKVRDLTTADFPFGTPLGTTVIFDQVIHYRQQLATVNPFNARRRWVGPGGMNYEPAETSDAAAPAIGVVRTRAFSFNDVFDIVLDTAHNLQFNFFGAERYVWDVMAFTADADGRILAIIQVLPSVPRQIQSTEFLGLNRVTGDLEEHATAYIVPFLPMDPGPIWALLDVAAARVLASTAGPELALISEAHAEAPPFGIHASVRLGPLPPMTVPGVWIKTFEHYEGGSLAGVIAEREWAVVPVGRKFSPELGSLKIRGEVQASVGLETLTATGVRRGDLAEALPVSTTIDEKTAARDLSYLEVNTRQHDGLRVVTSEGVVPSPSQLFDVRPWGAGGTPKLAFLALDDEAAGGATHVITWDHEAGRATLVADLGRGAHGLTSATSSTALVNSYLGADFEPAGFVVRLDETRSPVAFLGESMWSFTVLEPSYLYNAEDAKFYRLSPPLQRTALPATLAGPAETSGDFHAIRLP